MSDKPKNQHWVPRFYLKYFATPETRGTANPKIYVIDKTCQIPEPRLTSTKKIFGQRYLYSPKNVDGDRDWNLEDFLAKLEGSAAAYWDTLAEGQLDLLEPRTRTELAKFVAALHLRNKLLFDLVTSIMANRDALFGGLRPTGHPKYLEPHKKAPDPTHPGRFFVQSFRNQLPWVTKTFASYHWMILRCDSDVLRTSDTPVTFINSTRRRSGPGTRNAKAIFPVSPRTLLHMCENGGQPASIYREVDAGCFRKMNELIFHFANRFIIAGINPRKA